MRETAQREGLPPEKQAEFAVGIMQLGACRLIGSRCCLEWCQRRRQWETNWAFRNGSGTMAGDGNEKGPADRSTGPCRS